ncbi:recombinase family protein [Streptomyces sp. NPDC093586]|uniref:recombinase family protein n=1 Tax=Streptomyces sp. NPDC093586 TaxID=3366042 RepID=UPI00381BE268
MIKTVHTSNSSHDGALAPAVLYVCAQRGTERPTVPEEHAVDEGHAFADEHHMRIVAEITDPYGDPDPAKRPGWRRVKEMAEHGQMTAVIVRWPNSISPDDALRYPEIAWCRQRGVRVLFSWSPLGAQEAP